MTTEIRCDACGAPLKEPRTLLFSAMPKEEYFRKNQLAKDAGAAHLGLQQLDLCDACERRLFEGLRKLVK